MTARTHRHEGSARVVIRCRDLDANLAFFTDVAGFRIDRISPADSPREVDLGGHGIGLRLLVADVDEAGIITVDPTPGAETTLSPGSHTAPNGTVIEFTEPRPAVVVPPGDQVLEISRLADSTDFASGRAGMGYRDLVPNRVGGRFIASHIRIAEGGPVPDYVHFHKIRFQMIYCYKGWVRVVYEDQGAPFVLRPGDCVLQPPEIRHRVLESSPGLEVIEIGCPAEHDTFADHTVALPTRTVDPDRDFGGQRFVRHVADGARWVPSTLPGFEHRDIGIGVATGGLAGARVHRPLGAARWDAALRHDGEFLFVFVLQGKLTLRIGPSHELLEAGDSAVIPAGSAFELEASTDAERLEVTLPADLRVIAEVCPERPGGERVLA